MPTASAPGRRCRHSGRVVEESLRAPVGHLGVTGKGVFVSSFGAAAGMSFDAVWMVGMIEGAVPPRIHDDPLLPETSWQEAGGPSRMGQRAARERYDYLSAAATAGHRTLSYPVANPESRRRAFPSRWLLEQARQLAGETVNAEDLTGLRGRAWLTMAPSLENSLAQIETPADCHDYNPAKAVAVEERGQRPVLASAGAGRAAGCGSAAEPQPGQRRPDRVRRQRVIGVPGRGGGLGSVPVAGVRHQPRKLGRMPLPVLPFPNTAAERLGRPGGDNPPSARWTAGCWCTISWSVS